MQPWCRVSYIAFFQPWARRSKLSIKQGNKPRFNHLLRPPREEAKVSPYISSRAVEPFFTKQIYASWLRPRSPIARLHFTSRVYKSIVDGRRAGLQK